MLPTEIDLAGGFVSVCVKNGWRHLSIISQNENIFTNVRIIAIDNYNSATVSLCIIINT